MRNLKHRLSNLAGKTSNGMKPAIKKSIMAGVTIAALSFSAGNAAHAAETKLTTKTIFYVYVNDSFVGMVADKTQVENLVEAELAAAKKNYANLVVDLGMNVSYIPEQVFSSDTNTNTNDVVTELKNQIHVQAEASAVMIDNKPVAYLKDKAAAEKVLDTLLLEYITEEELAAVKSRETAPTLPLPDGNEKETRIVDVNFSKEVSQSAEKIAPEKILPIEKAVELLKKGTLKEQKYQVQEGDVLGTIASDHNLKLAQLLSLNKGLNENSILKPGQEINVTVLKPFVDVVVHRQVYAKEEIAFKKEVIEDPTMPKGDTKKKQEGKVGIKGMTYSLTEQNGKTIKKEVLKETVLEEPVTEIIRKGTKVIPSRGDGTFAWPTNGGYISSRQGYRWSRLHKGIDIARPSNYTIKAADNGTVVYAGNSGDGYGNKIIVDHNNGYRTLYAHLASISVNVGQTVSRGSKIGVMGRTGNSTGIHLHFEVHQNGKIIDPLSKVNRN